MLVLPQIDALDKSSLCSVVCGGHAHLRVSKVATGFLTNSIGAGIEHVLSVPGITTAKHFQHLKNGLQQTAGTAANEWEQACTTTQSRHACRSSSICHVEHDVGTVRLL